MAAAASEPCRERRELGGGLYTHTYVAHTYIHTCVRIISLPVIFPATCWLVWFIADDNVTTCLEQERRSDIVLKK